MRTVRRYGSGSSREWAAKGPFLQNVRFVVAESFERIHRSNLVGMGLLPLQFKEGENADTLGLTGKERFSLDMKAAASGTKQCVTIQVTHPDGKTSEFQANARLDTDPEVEYFKNGGILAYVLRKLARQGAVGQSKI